MKNWHCNCSSRKIPKYQLITISPVIICNNPGMSSPRPLRSLFPGRPPSAPLLTASSAADTAALWFRAQFRIRSFWWTDGPPFAAIVSFGVSHHGPQCLSSEFWTVFHWRWRKGVKTKQREKRTEEIWYYKVNSIDFFKFCFVGGGGIAPEMS